MLSWRGDQVRAKADEAARQGINATMAAAIIHAKANHGAGSHGANRFETQTGELERSIRIVQPAKRDRKSMVGIWGAKGLAYARRIELGFQGKDSLGRVFDSRPYPFLTPAADVEYPKLAGRIKKAF